MKLALKPAELLRKLGNRGKCSRTALGTKKHLHIAVQVFDFVLSLIRQAHPEIKEGS